MEKKKVEKWKTLTSPHPPIQEIRHLSTGEIDPGATQRASKCASGNKYLNLQRRFVIPTLIAGHVDDLVDDQNSPL